MKKIFYLLVLITLCFLANINITEASNQCKYFSANSKTQKNYSFDGECPVVVDKEGNEVDLSVRGIYKTDDFYILDGYEIIDGNSTEEYSGQIYFAQAIYYEEKTILSSYGRYFYVTYNNGNFFVKMSPMGNDTLTNHIKQQNFFTEDNKKFTPHEKIYYKSTLDAYASKELVDLYILEQDIPTGGLGTIREANLKSSVIIYKELNSTDNYILDVVNYCGAFGNGAEVYTATLYSNNVIKFSGAGNPSEIKLSEDNKMTTLPNEICVTHYNNGGIEISAINLGKCNETLVSKTYTKNCNVDSSEDVQEVNNFINGNTFKRLLGAVKNPLLVLNQTVDNFTLRVGSDENFKFGSIESNDDLCSNSNCIANANYYTEKGLKNIRSYCNVVYEKYSQGYNSDLDDRMNECISFNQFYSQLVNEGIVNDLADYCGILSEDFVEKLAFVLNIIMIAGPILAILLGSLDFIKVITNGDADKEMKTAFKHFMIRVGSAALLFIVPLLLSFILNIFMANEGGYDPENPFCNVNDWSE